LIGVRAQLLGRRTRPRVRPKTQRDDHRQHQPSHDSHAPPLRSAVGPRRPSEAQHGGHRQDQPPSPDSIRRSTFVWHHV